VRAHWHVENRLHWVMDVVFHDDLVRLRTQNGPANMAAVRHVSLNLIRRIDDKASLKVGRKTSAWVDDYLFAALTGPNPRLQAIPLTLSSLLDPESAKTDRPGHDPFA
jgi:hypothetical protein